MKMKEIEILITNLSIAGISIRVETLYSAVRKKSRMTSYGMS